VVRTGTPEQVVTAGTHTGVALAPVLARGIAGTAASKEAAAQAPAA
jgi:hypothetical protein